MKKKLFVTTLLLTLSFVLAGKAEAIVVDGLAGDWVGIDPVVTDGAEDGIPDKYDISDVFVTDNGNTIFFRIDVYNPPPTFEGEWGPEVLYQIAIDVDNNPLSGFTGDGSNGLGLETIINYTVDGASIFQYSSGWSYTGSAVAAMNQVMEVGSTLNMLGITTGDTIAFFVYLDNAGQPPDDFAPDLGGASHHTTVPEPSTILLLGQGGLLLLLVKKKLK